MISTATTSVHLFQSDNLFLCLYVCKKQSFAIFRIYTSNAAIPSNGKLTSHLCSSFNSGSAVLFTFLSSGHIGNIPTIIHVNTVWFGSTNRFLTLPTMLIQTLCVAWRDEGGLLRVLGDVCFCWRRVHAAVTMLIV